MSNGTSKNGWGKIVEIFKWAGDKTVDLAIALMPMIFQLLKTCK